MDPNSSPQTPGQFTQGPTPQPGVTPPAVSPQVASSQKKSGKSKTLIIIVVAAIFSLVLILGAVLIFGGKDKKQATQQADQAQTETTQTRGPRPASAIDMEQINNSINQDVSGLNDDEDFPPSQLDDKSLGL